MKEHFCKEMVLTGNDKRRFRENVACYICGKEYLEAEVKVRDHCRVIGKCRGFTHHALNVNFQLADKIPVILDNLPGYDSHFIVDCVTVTN